ncbi:hypothetical protein, partial [Halovulum sp. GXIMD14793]
ASCSLIIPMIWTSVKRLFRIRLLLQKVEQTLHQNEGSFGGQVRFFEVIAWSDSGICHMIEGPDRKYVFIFRLNLEAAVGCEQLKLRQGLSSPLRHFASDTQDLASCRKNAIKMQD